MEKKTHFLPVLLLLFVGSGCAALIYEIVWFQILQLVIGSSAISLGVLLGTFMGGMCLGSLCFARLVSARHHPLRVYALLESAIGLIGLILLYSLPYVGQWYSAFVGRGLSSPLLRGAVCAACLLPPTVLMGATLPAIARWMQTTRQGVSELGFFYGANIAGAVFGCLLAGFYLLRVYDVMVATYVAVAINATVAATGLGLAMVASYRVEGSPSEGGPQQPAPRRSSVYLAIALSGMSALGAEVIWTRLLSLMLGATVYTFSIILSVFLVGLGIGSSVGSMVAGGAMNPRVALGTCQLLLTAAIAWTAYTLTQSLPYWPIDVSLATSPWTNFQMDLMRCAWAVLPAACLWGASFPLALASAASPGQDPSRLVGRVYAANTLGAIAGSLLFSILIVSWLGTQRAQQLIIGLSAVAALLMLAPRLWPARSRQPTGAEPDGILGSLALVAVLGITGFFVWSVAPTPPALVGYGRFLPTYLEPQSWGDDEFEPRESRLPDFIYFGEGMNASIAVSEFPDGTRNFHVSGKVVASSEPQDMRLQRMLGHLPALIHPRPKSVLIVGCGAGVTAGSFVVHPDVERIVICEIEPLVPPAAGKYFGLEIYKVMKDPRVEIVYDDARHYIVTTKETFDIITSDPIHPWVKGAAALYSREYYELCKTRLNPGGVVTQWVPLYESNELAVKSQIATFFEAFPNGTIWSNDDNGAGYDIVLLGQREATKIDLDRLQERLDRDDHLFVTESLEEVNLGSALSLMTTYAGRASDLQKWLQGGEINRDRNLRLQYLAGMGLNLYDSELIFDRIVAFRTFPDDLFSGNGISGRALRALIEEQPPQPNE